MTSSVKNTALKVKTYFVENKEKLKTRALVATGFTLGMTVLLFRGASLTRDQYLDEKGLTEDFKLWLYNPDEDLPLE